MEYQGFSSHCWTVISNVKVFKKYGKLQDQAVKNVGTQGKDLSLRKYMCNMEALALTVQKLLKKLQFQTELQNDKNNIFNVGAIKFFIKR